MSGHNECFEDYIHLISSGIFIISLAYLFICKFTKVKEGEKPSPSKERQNTIYRICGWGMIACIIIMLVLVLIRKEGVFEIIVPSEWLRSHFVFTFETIAIVFFGIAWITKSKQLLKLFEVTSTLISKRSH